MIRQARTLNLNHDRAKGRYLTAKSDLDPGQVIISEDAYSIVVTEENISEFCNHCFEVLDDENGVPCLGCSEAMYCSAECRRLAWKGHHWFECCISGLKIGMEAKMALRTLLSASFSIFQEEKTECASLHLVAENSSAYQEKKDCDGCIHDCNGNGRVYEDNYWSIYCLQTHAARPEVHENASEIIKDVTCLALLMLSCFIWHNSSTQGKGDLGFSHCDHCSELGEKGSFNTLIHSVFKKLSFSTYYRLDNFDIRSWRSFMLSCHDSSRNATGKTFEQIYNQKPATEYDLCLQLLLHHALQFRTNAQAAFNVYDLADQKQKGSSAVKSLSQIRVATAFFPTTSLMNHSCAPNTVVSFDGRKIKVVASKPIPKGGEVFHCYGPHYCRYTVEERRRLLKDQYFFMCDCEKCVSESSEDGEAESFKLQFHAFKCAYCDDPLKRGHQTTATCINTKCRKVQDISAAEKIYSDSKDVYRNASKLLDDGRFEAACHVFNDCLKKMKSILYARHIDIGKVHDQIAQCYVVQETYVPAIPHLCNSITIVGMLYGAQSVELAHELQKLASVYFNSGKVQEAAKTAKKALKIYDVHYPGPECCPPGVEEMRRIVNLSQE